MGESGPENSIVRGLRLLLAASRCRLLLVADGHGDELVVFAIVPSLEVGYAERGVRLDRVVERARLVVEHVTSRSLMTSCCTALC